MKTKRIGWVNLLLALYIIALAISVGMAENDLSKNQDITSYIKDIGLEPEITENKGEVSYCNYIIMNSNTVGIEWSDNSNVYSVSGDNGLIDQVYINLLGIKEWDSCSFIVGKKIKFSFNPIKKSKSKCKTYQEYCEKAQKILNIDGSGKIHPTLQKGDKGEAVQTLQERLKELHYLAGKADGAYGDNTKKAIMSFQSKAKIDKTGIADTKTQSKLFSDNAPEADPLSISNSTIIIGNMARSMWDVEGHEFTLVGNQTKTIETRWGTFVFNAVGEQTQIE